MYTEKQKRELAKKFSEGWKHFCGCVNFADSPLDAEAIRFMNEMPGKVIEALRGKRG